jgi:hypothetical protein
MKIITPSILILGFFVLGGMIFKLTSPIRCGPILPNDNIFVLTGDARRVPFAMRQTKMYPSAKIHIIGAGGHRFDTNGRHIAMETKSKSTQEQVNIYHVYSPCRDENRNGTQVCLQYRFLFLSMIWRSRQKREPSRLKSDEKSRSDEARAA